jgi:signal transduction histidine kinase
MLDRARPARVGLAATCLLGLAAGLVSVWLGWSAPSFGRWGVSPVTLALGLAAGWALILRAATARGLTHTRAPMLMAGAGGTWAISEWVNPGSAPAIVFTLGLLLGSAWPAVLTHAALSWPEGRSRPTVPRLILVLAYGSGLVLMGLLPALAFDPAASGCRLCPPSLVGVGLDPTLASTATRIGLVIQVIWLPVAAWILLRQLWRMPASARASTAGLRLPVVVVLAAVVADSVYTLSRGFRSNTALDMAIWSVEALGLVSVGAAAAIESMRARRTRRSVARLALDLSSAPPAGELGKALGRLLDDPALEVIYPLDRDTFVDAAGHAVDGALDPARERTAVVRGGAPVAQLVHGIGVARDESRVSDALASARLALENERLHAVSQARLRELRASRAQIVAAADAERRRLERDLHDGSQQRLLALAIELAIARQRGPGDDSRLTAADHAVLEDEVRAALGDLRRLAHGIYPRSLADDGLQAALEELAEDAPIPISLLAVPDGRLDPRIEAAAYLVVARAIERPAARRASVEARRVAGQLLVDVYVDGDGPFEIVDLEDRVGAMDGTIAIGTTPDGRTQLRAEIPCAS